MKKERKCLQCSNKFFSYNPDPQFCSKKCMANAQAPPIDFQKAKQLYESGLSQDEVGEELGVSQKSIYKLFKRNNYNSRIAVKRNQLGKNNDSWKGNDATYAAFHARVEAIRGKPHYCFVCGTMETNIYEWANLTGRYEDINDYSRMCRKCHRKYDKNRPNSSKHVRQKAK